MSVSMEQYKQGRRAISHAMGLALWVGIWLVNGYFTVVALNAWGETILAGTYNPRLESGVLAFGTFLSNSLYAWGIHILGSLVEGFSWRNIGSVSALTGFCVLILDIYTTFIGMREIIAGIGFVVAGMTVLGILMLALGIALLPELVIVRYLQEMHLIGKRKSAETGYRRG